MIPKYSPSEKSDKKIMAKITVTPIDKRSKRRQRIQKVIILFPTPPVISIK